MQPTVAIAYRSADDSRTERELLQAIDAKLVYIDGLDTPEAGATISAADALMVTTHRVPANLIDAMKHCRVISRVGTGLDAIDIPAATAHGIWVAYVPDYSVDEVSTHAIALLLSHARGIPRLIEAARAGSWTNQSVVPLRRLRGQTLGILGFGRIGQMMAAKASGLGMEVQAHDPFLTPEQIAAAGARPVDWETLLRTSDYLSLHAPLTNNTQKVINAQTLALMKPSAVLINTARGGLIDEEALDQALKTGRLAAAALDVLSVEPPPPDHPLFQNSRVMITPHSAWYSEDANHDVRVRASEEVVRVLRGERPRCPANELT
jgi:D-3-phosphoglycerate dehydrogenase / 2-oxoglutarate reductase